MTPRILGRVVFLFTRICDIDKGESSGENGSEFWVFREEVKVSVYS